MKKYILPILLLMLVAGSIVYAQSDFEIIELLRARIASLKSQIEIAKQKQVFGSAGQVVQNAPISGTVQNGTTGSILFVGSSQKLTQNNSNLFWDDTIRLPQDTIPLFDSITETQVRQQLSKYLSPKNEYLSIMTKNKKLKIE
mgnify:CR=1 FL=1